MSETTIGVLLAMLCTIVEGFAQTFFKKSALAPAHARRWVGLGLALYGGEVLLYTVALQFLDVSTAYPIGSLSFVAVTVLSQVLLHENVNRTRWIGVVLIIIGAALVVAQA